MELIQLTKLEYARSCFSFAMPSPSLLTLHEAPQVLAFIGLIDEIETRQLEPPARFVVPAHTTQSPIIRLLVLKVTYEKQLHSLRIPFLVEAAHQLGFREHNQQVLVVLQVSESLGVSFVRNDIIVVLKKITNSLDFARLTAYHFYLSQSRLFFVEEFFQASLLCVLGNCLMEKALVARKAQGLKVVILWPLVSAKNRGGET